MVEAEVGQNVRTEIMRITKNYDWHLVLSKFPIYFHVKPSVNAILHIRTGVPMQKDKTIEVFLFNKKGVYENSFARLKK